MCFKSIYQKFMDVVKKNGPFHIFTVHPVKKANYPDNIIRIDARKKQNKENQVDVLLDRYQNNEDL